MGSGFRVWRGARVLAAAVFVTLFGALTMGSTQGPSSTRPSARPASSPSRRAPDTVTGSVRHRVVKGENLFRIALSYGVSVEELCRTNGIKDQNLVTEGSVLFVPVTLPAPRTAATGSRRNPTLDSGRGRTSETVNGTVSAALSQAAARPHLITSKNRTVITNLDDDGHGHDDADTGTYTEEIPPGEGAPSGISFRLIPSDEPFSWPVQDGIVRSPFGPRHGRQHAGIDICAPTGSPIYAARDGVVAYSGHKFRGYGNVVMVDHSDGFTTVYAHNTANLVREGESVVRGQIIARVGATGNATGAHCHFEIRNENISVDPRGYLSESPEEDAIFARGGSPVQSSTRKQAAIPPALIP